MRATDSEGEGGDAGDAGAAQEGRARPGEPRLAESQDLKGLERGAPRKSDGGSAGGVTASGGGGGGERGGDCARASPISLSVEPVLSEVSAGAVPEAGAAEQQQQQQQHEEDARARGWEQQGGKTLAPPLNGGAGAGAGEQGPSIGNSLQGALPGPRPVSRERDRARARVRVRAWACAKVLGAGTLLAQLGGGQRRALTVGSLTVGSCSGGKAAVGNLCVCVCVCVCVCGMQWQAAPWATSGPSGRKPWKVTLLTRLPCLP